MKLYCLGAITMYKTAKDIIESISCDCKTVTFEGVLVSFDIWGNIWVGNIKLTSEQIKLCIG